jgi:tRNA-uridine 2-sulfurtransferase
MKKVLLGMSGGIDSAVSALLLQKEGYEVIGATMSFWDGSIEVAQNSSQGCFGPHEAENIAAARRICEKLQIPHYVVDLREEFAKNVLSYFRETYLKGRTPNPCVVCNLLVKFGAFPRKARRDGITFDHFATGHYARAKYDGDSGRWQLLKAMDPAKDQSYFLSFLSQEQLAMTLFPLGELLKPEVKRLAGDIGLDFLQERDESQDFLDPGIQEHVLSSGPGEPGDIVDMEGKVIGKHRGIAHYTIGQRRHLGVSGMAEPHFVIRIDAGANLIVAGSKRFLYGNRLIARDINWISIPALEEELRAQTRIRLAHDPAPCILNPLKDGRVEVLFDAPQLSITPGQIAVFYSGDVVLGGGIIV